MHEHEAAVVEAGRFMPAPVRAFTTTRAFAGKSLSPFDRCNLGSRCDDDPDAVAANRAALIRNLALPSPPRWLQQVHGTRVVEFESDDDSAASEPEADAAISRVPGVVLAVLTADCLPLLLAAADGTEIAAVHAGWRGLSAGVIESCFARMRTPPGSVQAWLGPAIGSSAYEVGADVRSACCDADPGAASAFEPTRPGHWLCDLYALARRRLQALGVAHIAGGDLCTWSDPQRFYSYRRDRITGRMASLVWIAPTTAGEQ